MPSRTAFLCVLQLILGTSAFAQNASSAASKDCQSSDTNRRLSGCTEVINARGFGSQSNFADALDGRCWAYNDKEQFTLAIADCKASIRLRPRNFYAYNNLGTAYVGIGNYSDALSAFDTAIELKPDFYWSRFNRAKALIALGRKEDAIKDYEYLLERDPSNQGIRNLLNGLRAEIATLPVPTAETPSPVLRSLPPAVQKEIEQVRESCPLDEKNTSGDEGLQTFTVSGAQAVLVDTLNFCGEGRRCLHSVNCATGYTHSVAIYVRYGNVWRKSFSVDATEPIFLSVEPYAENPKFRALVLSVHAGWDLGCPVRNKNDGTAWKREKCDFVVKWDGTKFTYKPL